MTICPADDIFLIAGKNAINYQWQTSTDTGYTNIMNDSIYSGATTDTVHIINPPTAWYGNKYRCMMINASDTDYTHEVVLKFATNWTGTISTAWENPANWSCGTSPDANTDAIIITGTPYYPIINNSTSCRSINLLSPASINITPGINLTLTGK